MWEHGTVVQSLAGRDKGYLLCVVGYEDGLVLVCDGKERPIERPKKKNPMHLIATGAEPITWQLRGNHALRKALARLKAQQSEKGEFQCQNQI